MTMRKAARAPQRRALGYLCDGCHDDPCRCDEIEAERAEEYGPLCWACGGGQDDDYGRCEFAGDPVYVPGPGSADTYGCPRMTGTF